MGTNYYLHINHCKHCGRYEKLHIGKSSAGWRFLFQFIKGKAENIKEWDRLIKQGIIYDEYGKIVFLEDFWQLVDMTQEKQSHRKADTSTIDVEGYDFIKGEFR